MFARAGRGRCAQSARVAFCDHHQFRTGLKNSVPLQCFVGLCEYKLHSVHLPCCKAARYFFCWQLPPWPCEKAWELLRKLVQFRLQRLKMPSASQTCLQGPCLSHSSCSMHVCRSDLSWWLHVTCSLCSRVDYSLPNSKSQWSEMACYTNKVFCCASYEV